MYDIVKPTRQLQLLLWLILSPLLIYAQRGAEGDVSVRQVEYMVRNGDHMAVIAARFEVPLADLLRLNKINSPKYVAYPGRVLVIPVQVRAKAWDPSHEASGVGSQAAADRGRVRDYETIDNPNDYNRGEDFIDLAEAREDSVEFENIKAHIARVDKKIATVQHRVDSIKKNEFTFTFDEKDKSAMLEKMKAARDRYYLEGPMGQRLDSLRAVKTKLIQRQLKLHDRITEYENLMNNAAYNERNFVLKKVPKDAMWGDVLKYQSKYVNGKLVQVKVQETNPDTRQRNNSDRTTVSVKKNLKPEPVDAAPAIAKTTAAAEKPVPAKPLPIETKRFNKPIDTIPSVTASPVEKSQPIAIHKPEEVKPIDTIPAVANTRIEKSEAINRALKIADSLISASSQESMDTIRATTQNNGNNIPAATTIIDAPAIDSELVSKYPMFDFAQITQQAHDQMLSSQNLKKALVVRLSPYSIAIRAAASPLKENIAKQALETAKAPEIKTEKEPLKEAITDAPKTATKEPAKVTVKESTKKPVGDSGAAYVSASGFDSFMLRDEKSLYNDPAIGFAADTNSPKGLKVQAIELLDSKKQPRYLTPVDTMTRIKGDFFMARARLELEKGDFKAGEKYLRKSLDINPNSAEAWMLHADIYLAVGVSDQALKDYIISSEIDSSNPKVFYNMALVYAQQKDNKKSMQCFTKAIDLNGKYLPAYMGRASLLLDENNAPAAIEDYTKVLNVNRYYSPAFKARGLAKMDLKKYADAVADFDEFLEMDGKDGFVTYERGIAKILSNNLLQGCIDLSRARDLGFKEAEKAIKKFCQ